MVFKKKACSTCIFFMMVLVHPVLSEEIIPPAPIQLKAVAGKSIQDITIAESILGKEDFRPKGKSIQLSLDEAISIALKNNPDMQISRHDLLRNIANQDLTESAYRSQFNLDSRFDETLRRRASGSFRLDPERGLIADTVKSYENDTLFTLGPRYTQTFKNGSRLDIQPEFQYQHSSEGAFDRGVNNPEGNNYEDRYSLSINYSFPINSRSREQIHTDLENAKIATLQADYSLFSQGKTIEQVVINRYWNIKQLQEQVDINRERLLQSKRIAFIIETQYEFENAAKQDVGQAQTDVLNNESTLIGTERNLRNAMEGFNLLLGTPIESELDLTDELSVEPLSHPAAEYIAMITSSNLQLKNLRLSIRRQENSLRVARLGQQPDFLLTTFATQNDESDRNLGAALIFSWPFGDGGATRARVRALQESIEQSKIRLWDLERQLIQETYGDLRELSSQVQRIEILQRNVEQSQYNLENGLINFQEFGRISFRDMQDLQIDLALNRSNLVQAKVLYNIAKTSLMSKVHDYKPTEDIEYLLTSFDP